MNWIPITPETEFTDDTDFIFCELFRYNSEVTLRYYSHGYTLDDELHLSEDCNLSNCTHYMIIEEPKP